MTRPTRIAHVIARLNVGGPAALVLTVASGLDPTEFESVVLHGEVGEGEADWRDVRGADVPTRVVRGLGPAIRPGADARALADLVRALRVVRPDIVHTHTAKAGVLGRVAARAAGRPKVVHTFHGHVLHGYFSPRAERGITRVERALARRTDRIVTVGARVRDDLLAAGVGRAEQYRVIPPGVDPLPLPPADEARRRLGLPADVPVVAFVGRLTAIKRPDRAVEVVRRVRAAGTPAHLVIAGDGELRGQVEALAAPLGDAVTLLGWTPDVGAVLAAADVALLTSDNEGMPVTLAEAAHAGVPAVATDVGAVAEVVVHGRTGLVVPPDTAALTDALVELLNDPARRAAMSAGAKDHAGAQLTTSRLVAAHEALYREVTQ